MKKGEGTNANDFEKQTRGFGKNQKFVKRWNLLQTNEWRSLTAQLFIALSLMVRQYRIPVE